MLDQLLIVIQRVIACTALVAAIHAVNLVLLRFSPEPLKRILAPAAVLLNGVYLITAPYSVLVCLILLIISVFRGTTVMTVVTLIGLLGALLSPSLVSILIVRRRHHRRRYPT